MTKSTLATLPMCKAGMLEIVLISPLKPYAGFASRPKGSANKENPSWKFGRRTFL